MKKILMLHGINHNMFGKRDPAQYGTITLAQIDARLQGLATELGVQVESFQTNHEGAMCERIHRAFEERQKLLARDEARAERLHVRRHDLNVQPFKSARAQVLYQVQQREL